jgi:hypothetical protein
MGNKRLSFRSRSNTDNYARIGSRISDSLLVCRAGIFFSFYFIEKTLGPLIQKMHFK